MKNVNKDKMIMMNGGIILVRPNLSQLLRNVSNYKQKYMPNNKNINNSNNNNNNNNNIDVIIPKELTVATKAKLVAMNQLSDLVMNSKNK